MAVKSEVVMAVAGKAIEAQVGPERAKAWSLLMFGAAQLDGLVERARLAAAASSFTGNLTDAAALGMVATVAKETQAARLRVRAASGLKAAGVSEDAVAEMSVMLVTGLLDSSPH